MIRRAYAYFNRRLDSAQSGNRNRSLWRVAISTAVVLPLSALTIVGSDPVAGASTNSAKPTISSFVANPSTLDYTGGSLELSANVTNATSCKFSAKPVVADLPATVACSNGVVNDTVIVQDNAGKKPAKYTFTLTATGTKTVEAEADVTVGIGPPSLKRVGSVASDGAGYCAILANGRIDCWGSNGAGQLGNGTIDGPNSQEGDDTAQAVLGISNAVSISGDGLNGGYCAVLSTGGIDCWGINEFGQLGNGTTGGPDGSDQVPGYDTPQKVSGVTDAVSVTAAGSGDYCALLAFGGVDCWGNNNDGQLGNGTIDGPDGGDGYSNIGYDTAQTVTGISNAVSVTAGGTGYCAVLSTGGIECWGDNSEGELGDGSIDGTDGEDGYDTPQTVTGITDVRAVTSDGNDSYCAVLSTDGIDCWGYNGDGELGIGTFGGPDVDGYDSPQAVTGINNAASVASGGIESFCALLTTGEIDCWGYNYGGQLGNGTTGESDSPQAVTGITNAISVSSNDATANPEAYCAVLSTGGVDCWGDNVNGQLGNGTVDGPDGTDGFAGYDTPQAVLGISTAVSVVGFSGGDCTVLSTGGIKCWGLNLDGELGNGTFDGPDPGDGYVDGSDLYVYDWPTAVVSR